MLSSKVATCLGWVRRSSVSSARSYLVFLLGLTLLPGCHVVSTKTSSKNIRVLSMNNFSSSIGLPNQKTEWTRARLKYTSLLNICMRAEDDPVEMNTIRWTVDYPKSDRAFLFGVRRLTRINSSSVEQVTGSGRVQMIFFNWPSLYSVEPGYWDLSRN